jgi:hypothetical protein
MATALADLLEQVEELSFEDLLTLQEKLTGQMRVKSSPTSVSNGKRVIKIPGAYQPTLAEIEASFARTFTAEQLAAMDEVDLDNLPVGEKTLSEMVNEDREDRF